MKIPEYGVTLGDKKVVAGVFSGDKRLLWAFYALPEPYEGTDWEADHGKETLPPIMGILFTTKRSVEVFGSWFECVKAHIEELPD